MPPKPQITDPTGCLITEAPPKVIEVVPRKPAGRRLITPVFRADMEDPVYSRLRKGGAISWRTIVLSASITAYTFYAVGDLPEVNAAFTDIDTFLRARNEILVSALLNLAPFVGVLLFAMAIAMLVLLHYNRLRRVEVDRFARRVRA